MRSFGLCSIVALVAASTASAFNYTIGVGRDPVTGYPGVGFNPSRTVTRGRDDTLVFVFLGGSHRVVQTSLENPCTPSSDFDTGLRTIPSNVTEYAASPFRTSFTVPNTSTVAYFADIGPTVDNSGTQCQQGAIFCVNTNESGDGSCSQMLSNALALGAASGVTTSSRPPYTLSTSTSSSTTATRATRPASTGTPAPSSSQPASSGVKLELGQAAVIASGMIGIVAAVQLLI
ncbi:hypothetical protein OIO90_003540 [Microbotryomycetes sp. JL221]|nr:hypothetical protein OIO90_003540 [Microbotryomycetes sp. JL221]